MRIREKNTLHAVLAVHNQGFVCLYFLVLFLLCTSIITILLASTQDRLKTGINIKKANMLLSQESAVLQYIKCELRKESLEDGSYDQYGVSFSVSCHGDRIDAVIHSPQPEILHIEKEDEHHVYDYETVRSELAA